MTQDEADDGYLRDRSVLEDGDEGGMRDLASSPGCRPEMLYYLAGQRDTGLRELVAANPAAPAQADELLCGDDSPAVRATIARKVAHRLDGVGSGMAEKLRESARTILERLARDQAVEVRRIVAEEVRLSAAIPRELAITLARDIDEGVCCPVLEFSPLLEDDDLVALIDGSLASPALSAVARRDGLGERVCDRVAQTLDEQAVAALLTNESAQIREATIDMLLDAAPDTSAWHLPLVRRPGLSGSAIRRIATFIADELIDELARRDDLTAKMVGDLRGAVRVRVAGHAAETPDDQMVVDALVAELTERHMAGGLTAGFIAEAAEAGRHAEVWVGLGLLSGAGHQFAHRIFASRNAKAIVALSWLANLPAWLSVALQTGIGGIPERDCLKPRGMSEYPLSEKEMIWQLDLFGYRKPEERAV
jgi:uncharacterized protein (DUF2336 family)